MALVFMAFLAVLREGFETSVFLLAAFNDATDPASAGFGVVIGLVVAVALGYGIYRGGVHLDLARFFRATGIVLVLVAAGLVASSLHTGAEAGWVTGGQGQALDLSTIVQPGTVWESLITGVLGIQPKPTLIEVIGWLLYAIPMLVFLLAPATLQPRLRASFAGAAVVAAPIVLVAGTLGGNGPAQSSASTIKGARTVPVTITDEGCSPASLRLPSGPATFVVTGNAVKVTEFEIVTGDRALAEAENVTAGLSKRFSLTLQPGTYELRCPNPTKSASGKLVVTGARASSALDPELARGVDGYRTFLETETARLVDGVQKLQRALASGDVGRARRAYAEARVPYERVEPVAESFGDLDPRIDARVNDVPRSKWMGFHRIERRLWIDKTTGLTAGLARGLVRDSRRLQVLVRSVKLEPAQVANGANELLGEVSKSKITGEEERYSRLDLLDFAANIDGARAAFDAIRPALVAKDPQLEREIERRFDLVDAALRPHRRGDGFVPYDALRRSDVRRLSAVIDALAEPLSRAPARALTA